MNKILVTGGAGAIGSNVVAILREQRQKVTVLDDLSSGHRRFVPEDVEFIEGSITDDTSLAKAFSGKPDYVLHMAALFANQNSVDHPVKDLDVNGLGTLKVLERCSQSNVRKVVYTSSSCVYGHKELMDENDVHYDLDTPYAVTKLMGEHYCRLWSRYQKLDTVILRLFNTYGPGEFPGRYRNVVPNFIREAMAGRPLTITGTGEESRDFNFVEDTARGIVSALFAETKSADVFNIASGRETRIIDLATKINALTGNKAGVNFGPRRAWDSVLRRRGNIEKAQAAFGYRAQTTIDDGLQRTYAWLKQNAADA